MRLTYIFAFMASIVLAIGSAISARPLAGVQGSAKVDFGRDVLPILKASCLQCHGAERKEGGLRLDQKMLAMRGGVSGADIVAGKGAQSKLVQRIVGAGGLPRMPIGFAPLSSRQIAAIRAWIDQGADWPDSASAKHWAYVKPVRPVLPKVKNAGWVRNPIDNFVLARLEKEGLKPSPEASRETLLRRVTLDLTGLPPTIAEIDAFMTDRSPDAYEKVVDRLLASPRFGERWTRPWLDMARYADTNGYEKDGMRSIWPYRDWVIDAFNKDMPYDRFTIEQIAGDLLPNSTREQKIATGFHRNTMQNTEGGVDQEEQRWLTLLDRVNTTCSVWLGSTFQCAQCHNHKFDPFTTQDYYRFLAFFDHSTEPSLTILAPDQETKQKQLQRDLSVQEAKAKSSPDDKAAAAKLAELKKQLGEIRGATTLVLQEKEDKERPSTFFRVKGAFLSKGDKVEADVPKSLTPLAPGEPVNRLGLAHWILSKDNPLTARVAVNRFWAQLFGRGIVETEEDFGTQGRPPSHPELLDWLAVAFRDGWSSGVLEYWSNAGRPNNNPPPLQHSITPWRVKSLLKLIVTSATYRQSSAVTPLLREKDPSNKLLARGPRFRMEAEMIRDNSLASAGLLSGKIGGPSVYPLQPDGIWDVPYSGERWVTSTGEDRWRRSLYTFWRRSAPYPMFTTFDATSREFCTIRRMRTNTPLQALNLLNDPAFIEAARGLARRMLNEAGHDRDVRLAYGFRLCATRRPTPGELIKLSALYERERKRYGADEKSALALLGAVNGKADANSLGAWWTASDLPVAAALTVVANVLLNLDESLTKE